MLRQTATRFPLIGLVGIALATIAGCGWPFQPPPPPPPPPDSDGDTAKPLHETIFGENLDDPNYKGTQTCLTCHSNHAENIMETGHWNWSGAVANAAGLEGEIHGKVDLINNY